MSVLRRTGWLALVLAPVLLALAIGIGLLFLRQGGFAPYRVPQAERVLPAISPDLLAHGEYIARIGNCQGCHTARGGVPFAGGRAFSSRWGTVFSTNLTPDAETGLGDWSLPEFRHAMRHGVSRNGIASPAFPWRNFALLDDADLDALFAWLATLEPVQAPAPGRRLHGLAGWPGAMLGWRMLHQVSLPDVPAEAPPEWKRGRYLVDGLGHCEACHGRRGLQGSLPLTGYLAGGRVLGLGWYAPPLDGAQLQRWPQAELATYLQTGASSLSSAYGPMAEVIFDSLQWLTREDAEAMAVYLKSLRPRQLPRQRQVLRAPVAVGDGAALYREHCADCHGERGEGRDAWPPLRGAASLTAVDPINAVRLVLYGAVQPVTAGNPAPWSMPPFVHELAPEAIADIVNHARSSFGNQPPLLRAGDIQAMHGVDSLEATGGDDLPEP